MLRVDCLVVGQLQTNCYLVVDEGTRKSWIIDPGDDGEYIKRAVADGDLKPKMILATHGHFDHIMAALELQLAYKIPFLVHRKDEFLVFSLRKRAKYWLRVDSPPPAKIGGYLEVDQRLKLGEAEFEVMETPGHTPGSVSLYCGKEEIVFVGDLMFKEGVGRTDFSYSDGLELKKSIEKIMRLPADTVVYSGHGGRFRLREWY